MRQRNTCTVIALCYHRASRVGWSEKRSKSISRRSPQESLHKAKEREHPGPGRQITRKALQQLGKEEKAILNDLQIRQAPCVAPKPFRLSTQDTSIHNRVTMISHSGNWDGAEAGFTVRRAQYIAEDFQRSDVDMFLVSCPTLSSPCSNISCQPQLVGVGRIRITNQRLAADDSYNQFLVDQPHI